MNWLRTVLQDDAAPGAIGLVLALCMLSVGALVVRRRKVSAALEELQRTFTERAAAWTAPAQQWDRSEAGVLWAAVEATILFRSKDRGVLVVRRDPLEALDEGARKESRAGAEGIVIRLVGENLTAIGLILTFTLLGIVLVGPIFNALGAAKEAASGELQEAIRKMGAKFFVSAFALLGSVIFQFAARLTSQRLEDELAEGFRQFVPLFEEVETFHARAGDETVQRLGALGKEQAASAGAFATGLQQLGERVDRIGEDVAKRLGTTIKTEITQVAPVMAAAFAPGLGRIETGITSLRSAVENQAQTNLEALIAKLQDALSGGFQSQSREMAKQLAEFAAMLPQLQSQFSALATALGKNAEGLGDQNQRAMEALTGKIGQLLARFEAVSTGMTGAVAKVAQVSNEVAAKVGESASVQVSGLVETLARSAQQWSGQTERLVTGLSDRMGQLLVRFDGAGASMQGAVERVAQSSQQKTAELIAAGAGQAKAVETLMEGMRRAAASDVQTFEQRSQAFAELMGKTQAGIAQTLTGIEEAAARLEQVLVHAGAASASSRQAGESFLDAGRHLTEGAKRIEGTLQQQAQFAEREQQLLVSQRAAAESLERVLDGMLKAYGGAIDGQSKLLVEGWKTLAAETARIVSRTSEGFAESVDELTDTVKELKGTLGSAGAKQ